MEKLVKATKCDFCDKEPFIDRVSIRIASITESGKVKLLHENEEGSESLLVPACAYHMVLCSEGAVAMTMQGQLIQSKLLTMLEHKPYSELKIISKRRTNNMPERAITETAKVILVARGFQESFEKQLKELKSNNEVINGKQTKKNKNK